MNKFGCPVYMHVNYLEHCFPIEEIIAKCAEAGYDGIELRGRDTDGKRTIENYLAHVRKEAKKAGLGLTFGCMNDAHDPDKSKRQESLDFLKRRILFASENEISTLNVFAGHIADPEYPWTDFNKHGSSFATTQQWDMTVDYFKEAAEVAVAGNVDLCFETHNGYIHDLGKATHELLSRIDSPAVKANLDFGNIYLNKSNEGMEDEISSLDGYIGYVHLKNVIAFNPDFNVNCFFGTSLRDGNINNVLLLEKILPAGYRGIITLECVARGDKRHLMKQDLQYLRSILDQ